jgi:acetyl esterase/lipase
MAAQLPPTQVTIHERKIPGPDGTIPIVIYQPPVKGLRPTLFWIHGGAYLFGVARDDPWIIPIVETVGCSVVSIDYRLAPEHPFPAGSGELPCSTIVGS